MHQRRRPIAFGPPLLLLAGLLLAACSTPSARAGHGVALSGLGRCSAVPSIDGSTSPRGTWWRTVDTIDAAGVLTARRLYVGRDSNPRGQDALPAESSVSGPLGGVALVVTDDGTASRIRLVAIDGACESIVATRTEVVRSAIFEPRRNAIIFHAVDRASRADAGTFRLALDHQDGTAELVAPPLRGNLATAVGTVFGTVLRLDQGGSRLAVQSCTDLACLTRIFDLSKPGAPPAVVRGNQQGPLLGFGAGDLVSWGACLGYPCPLFAWDAGTGKPRQLLVGAESAALTGDGRRLVALASNDNQTALVEISVASGRSTGLRGVPPGHLPDSRGPGATVGLETAGDEVALVDPAGDPFSLEPDAAAQEVLP